MRATDHQTFEFITTDIIKLMAQHEVSGYMAQSMELEMFTRYVTDHLVYQLTASVLGHNEKVICWPVKEVRPATWWEHLKQRHFPRWATRRWPVKLRHSVRQLEIPVTELFPDATIYPQLGQPVRLVAHDFRLPMKEAARG